MGSDDGDVSGSRSLTSSHARPPLTKTSYLGEFREVYEMKETVADTQIRQLMKLAHQLPAITRIVTQALVD